MRETKQIVIIMILIGFFIGTTGCTPFTEDNKVEEIAPVIFWSVSDAGGGKLTISTMVPPLIKEKKRFLTQKVSLLKQGVKKFNLDYYREMKTGQLRMVFINENLARKGIISLINTFLGDPEVPTRLYPVIVKGNLDRYIKHQMNEVEDLDYFLYRMLKHYEAYNQGGMSIVTLHDFMKQYYSPYSSPILPLFKAGDKNFRYIGTALFQKGKQKATIQGIDDQIFQLMDNDRYLKELTLPKFHVSLGRVRSNVIMKLHDKDSSLSIMVKLKGRIEEYRKGNSLIDQSELKILTQKIEAFLEKHTRELLMDMQKWKVDPLQIGTRTTTPFSKPFNEKEWMQRWEKMKIKVDYQVDLQTLTKMK